MKRSISIFAIMLFGTMSAIPSHGVQMTGTIRNLMQQKEDKIKQLEECEGKKKGWMIAGISTIGLTAVGVGVNIVQANKSNKLSSEIEENKQQLERQQERLDRINDQISKKENEKAGQNKKDTPSWSGPIIGQPCDGEDGAVWKVANDGTDCLNQSEQKLYKCGCVAESNKSRNPDGKIGDACDEGRGIWIMSGDKWCVAQDGANVAVNCHCEPNAATEKTDAGAAKTDQKNGAGKPAMGNKVKEKAQESEEATKAKVGNALKNLDEKMKAGGKETAGEDEEATKAKVKGALQNLGEKLTPSDSQKIEKPKGNTGNSASSYGFYSYGLSDYQNYREKNKDVQITGYCLNKEGDTGSLDDKAKTYCWCDIHIPNYCSQSKLFADQSGLCYTGTNTSECNRFCNGQKRAALVKICDDLNK